MTSRRVLAGVVVGFAVLLGGGRVAHAVVAFDAVDDAATTAQDTAVDIDVTDNDVVPGSLVIDHIEIESSPSHGTATVDGLAVHYVPDPGYIGNDDLLYNLVACFEDTPQVEAEQFQQCTTSTAEVTIAIHSVDPTTSTSVAPTTTTTVEVVAEEESTTTAAPTTVAAAAELPRTGGGKGSLAPVGFLFVGLGAGALALARRRSSRSPA